MLSVWCGLAAGLLEVGTRALCRAIDPTKRLYTVSRHFVWLTPLANLLVFFALGLFLALVTRFAPPYGGLVESSGNPCHGDMARVSGGTSSSRPGRLVHPGSASRFDWFRCLSGPRRTRGGG